MKRALVAAVLIALAGCGDAVEPTLPNAPAEAQRPDYDLRPAVVWYDTDGDITIYFFGVVVNFGRSTARNVTVKGKFCDVEAASEVYGMSGGGYELLSPQEIGTFVLGFTTGGLDQCGNWPYPEIVVQVGP